MKTSLKRSLKISSYDINPRGQARLTAIANYFQESAYNHAEKLGWGYKSMRDRSFAWILSRMKIQILKYPDWDSTIEIETWPSGMESLFANRDFMITHAKGETLALASTAWLVVDYNTHRPLRVPEEFREIVKDADQVFEASLRKIPTPAEMKEASIHTVRYSDLDIVGHVNNVKYIEWCMDLIDFEEILKRGISEMEINYMSEARLGDEILIQSTEKDSMIFFSALNKENSRECFRATFKLF